MRDNPISEVHLHQRSSPYDFMVTMTFNDRSLELYSGTSYKNSLAAYWQAVKTLSFARLRGNVRMALTVERQLYGGFITQIDPDSEARLHVPDGECLDWAYKRTLSNVELMIGTIPGMLRPLKHPR